MSELRVGGSAMATPGTGAVPTASTTVRQEAWLLELERARWQAQPRYRQVEVMPGEAGGNEAEHLQAGTGRRTAAAQEALGSDSDPVAQRASAPAAPDWPTSTLLSGHLAMPSASAPSQRTPPAPTVSPCDRDPVLADVQAPPAEDAPATQRQAWQQRSVHVYVGEEATSVWVRDARLQPEGAGKLLQQLRFLLDGDRSPVQLSVNGQPVDGAPGR